MELPVPAPDPGSPAPLQQAPFDPDVVATGFAGKADDRFEAVCGELGILLARRVEPVSARVLPFGSEQVAMVERLDATTGGGPPPHAAVDAMTGGRNVLAAALPSAIAEGKVRTGVVFGDGDAPVRWGLADDEARLAALYAVVPHLGSFSATTGSDTYRVLRLPGIGVALVSEGASAATWVEGWFAALLHATRFALRTGQGSTDLVAHPTADPAGADRTHETPARVLEQLEDECRRILTAAQDQAREIREAAERDGQATARRASDPTGRADDRAEPPGDRDDREQLGDVRREVDAMLGDAERARATLLADAQREADAARRAAELSCASLMADTQARCEALVKDARREAKSSRRRAKKLRLETTRVREAAPGREARRDDVLGAARRSADDLLHDARRTADDVLHDARRAADGAGWTDAFSSSQNFFTQLRQMQAWLRRFSGTRARSAAGISTCAHQHGPL